MRTWLFLLLAAWLSPALAHPSGHVHHHPLEIALAATLAGLALLLLWGGFRAYRRYRRGPRG